LGSRTISGLDGWRKTPLAAAMRAVLQRVERASVAVENRTVGQIGAGLLVLLGISREDEEADLDWLARRIPRLRLFDDEEGVPNRSAVDIGSGFLVISQFTLHADTRKGNRPSYRRAADPGPARALYERFLERLAEESGRPVESGEFGAMMDIAASLSGPVTLLLDSRNRDG
jgi:D-tyrosyl-tRNA(Tyr) deacylase